MPEGDTLRRAELVLAPLLDGQVLESVWFKKLVGYTPRAGQRVDQVRAVGKHLLIDFDRNLTLDTHLGMAGSWRSAPAGTSRPSDPRLRVALGVAGGMALCFAAPTIRTYLRDAPPAAIAGLGPDLSDPSPDLDRVLERIDALARGDQPVADILLDQRIAAGVGNFFKSEALFVAGLDPHTPIGHLDAPARLRLWGIAHRLLRANARPGRRRTTPGGGDVFVYGRARLGCRRCDDAIRHEPAGPNTTSRSTYWCPTCQPAQRP